MRVGQLQLSSHRYSVTALIGMYPWTGRGVYSSEISSVRDVFPELGEGFILRCLEVGSARWCRPVHADFSYPDSLCAECVIVHLNKRSAVQRKT